MYDSAYARIGSPIITRDNVWEVYSAVLAVVQADTTDTTAVDVNFRNWRQWEHSIVEDTHSFSDDVLLENTKPLSGGLENGSHYWGGINHGNGLGNVFLLPFD